MRGPVAGDGGRALIVVAARWQQDRAALGGWQREHPVLSDIGPGLRLRVVRFHAAAIYAGSAAGMPFPATTPMPVVSAGRGP